MKKEELIEGGIYDVYEDGERKFIIFNNGMIPYVYFHGKMLSREFSKLKDYDYYTSSDTDKKYLRQCLSRGRYISYDSSIFEDNSLVCEEAVPDQGVSSTTSMVLSETDLQKAERLYPEGTRFASAYRSSNISESNGSFFQNMYGIYTNDTYVLYRGTWALKIESSGKTTGAISGKSVEKLEITMDAIKYLQELGYEVKMKNGKTS